MTGAIEEGQIGLFYSFVLEKLIPEDHLQRSTYRIPNIDGLRAYFVPIHNYTGRPSIDSASMIRMLFIGYCVGIHPDR